MAMRTLAQDAARMAVDQPLEWSVAVFCHNEAPYLDGCLRALAEAGRGAAMEVTVVLNGSTDASPRIAVTALREYHLRGRVCIIEQADKSNAINQYLHRLRRPAETHIFVDAYAAVAPDALHRLARRLREEPGANGAAAVPSTGRSVEIMRRHLIENRGLHGSLFALRGSFVERLAALGIRLPYGMYRGDGLIGAFVLHDLDALGGGWELERVVVEPQATWAAPVLNPWRPRDLRRQWRRMVQQARGRLQWPAIRQAIYDRQRPPHAAGFVALPPAADAAALAWMEHTGQWPRWWRDPLGALALRRMRQAPPPPPEARLTPRLLMETEA